MNPLVIPLVIRGLRGMADIAVRSDIIFRTSVINREIPSEFPPILDGFTKQDVRDYFRREGHVEKFSDERQFPGFKTSLEIMRLTFEEAKGNGLVENESEYLSHVGALKQLIILYNPDTQRSKELVRLIEGRDVHLMISKLPPELRQEIVLGYFMVGASRGGTEFIASKIALIIVDVLAEIGSEFVGQVVKDPELAKVLASFLSALSEPDLENLETDEFLRHVLKATLITISDNAQVITENELLESFIKSVAKEASTDVKALLAGKLYNRLISVVLSETARNTDIFIDDKLLSKVLSAVLDRASQSPDIKELFSEKGLEQLFSVGIKAVAENEDLWIGKVEPPLLKRVIEGIVEKVKDRDRNNLFRRENLVELINVAIGIIAKNPSLTTDEDVNDLIGKALEVISDAGVVYAFKHREAVLIRIVQDVLTEAGTKSHLLIKDEFASRVVEAILKSGADNLPQIASEEGLKNILIAALDAAATNIQLIEMKDEYQRVLQGVAKTLGKKDFNELLQGKNLERIFIEAIHACIKNIPFFIEEEEGRILSSMLDRVLNVALNDPNRLLGGDELVTLIKDILDEVSQNQEFVKKIEEHTEELMNIGLEIIHETYKRRVNSRRVVEIMIHLNKDLVSGTLALPLSKASIENSIGAYMA